MAERASEIAERRAFEHIKKMLPVTKVIAEPAGSGTAFPDFGYRLELGGKKVDLHFEFKDDWKTQMGSMRDWVYDGYNFSTPTTDADKETLIAIMNDTPSAKTEAKRILDSLKKYYSSKVMKLYSGALTVLPANERKKGYINWLNNLSDYQIANIGSAVLGQKVLDHYHKKFHANLQRDADYSILFFMIGDTIWFVEETGFASSDIKQSIAAFFNTKSITVLNGLIANLEVRIQPRPSLKSLLQEPTKPVKGIDVMASYRLKQKPVGGVKVM